MRLAVERGTHGCDKEDFEDGTRPASTRVSSLFDRSRTRVAGGRRMRYVVMECLAPNNWYKCES